MAKSLSQRIAERVALRKPNQKAKNRAAFLANKEEIAQALTDGWSMKLIWETLKDEKRIAFSYQAFTKYVKNVITKPVKEPVTTEPAEPLAKDAKPVVTTKAEPQTTPQKAEPKRFDFNPKPDPKELL